MSTFKTLSEQYQAYLHLQRSISKAIYNRDEGLLVQLKESSQQLFFQIEADRKDFIETSDREGFSEPSFLTDSSQLVLLMEQAQRQVHENETALQAWLGQMKADIQQYRSSQLQRGVLATYVQQKQAAVHRMTELENTPISSNHLDIVPVVTTSPSPWIVPSQESETVGHQFNEQS